MANKEFGQKLRELRSKQGYTQQQAASLIGLKNKSTLGSWEVGKSEPDAYTFLKLCKLYDVEDIYSAFDEVSPTQIPVDTTSVMEKYDMLADDYKKVVENQIKQLLQIQGKNEL